MDDRKASWVAAALGGVAIGGFWLVRPPTPRVSLRVLDQWTPTAPNDPDGDAAALFRVDLRGAGREDGRAIEYRIVGSDGHGYALLPAGGSGAGGVLKLPKGFAYPLDSPRLVATLDGRTAAEVSVRPIAPPRYHALVPSDAPPLALVLRGGSDLFAEMRGPLPLGERWRVVARRTLYADGLDAASSVGPAGSLTSRRLTVPFPEEAGLVEVDLSRYRLVPESDVVHLKGLRLARRFGGTTLIVDRSVSVANRLGADIRLPRQINGPRHEVRHGDLRVAFANLTMTPSWFPSLPADLRRSRGAKVEILRPAPESLGLRELRIASQPRRCAREPLGPLREGPFSATVRITFFRPRLIETRRMVLPVTLGAPLRFPLAKFVSDVPIVPTTPNSQAES